MQVRVGRRWPGAALFAEGGRLHETHDLTVMYDYSIRPQQVLTTGACPAGADPDGESEDALPCLCSGLAVPSPGCSPLLALA